MTRQHFTAMAKIVHAIAEGTWTNQPPDWAGGFDIDNTTAITRAVQTAEAFIILAQRFNPLFDRQRFLIACGLVEKPVKARKVKV